MSVERLVGHPGGVDLGPGDPHEWLCGYVWQSPTQAQRRKLGALGERIAKHESEALQLLRIDIRDQDWPAELRHRGGIVLHQLGRHAAAAKWAVRRAVVNGWRANLEFVPTKQETREQYVAIRNSAQSLSDVLAKLCTRNRMALQHAGLLNGANVLPSEPSEKRPDNLRLVVGSLAQAAANELERLGPPSQGDWAADVAAGDPAALRPDQRLAHEAVHVWSHFRPDRRPSGKAPGPFLGFLTSLNLMATGRSANMERAAKWAVKSNVQLLSLRYPHAASTGAPHTLP